jgi:hypothetical protein
MAGSRAGDRHLRRTPEYSISPAIAILITVGLPESGGCELLRDGRVFHDLQPSATVPLTDDASGGARILPVFGSSTETSNLPPRTSPDAVLVFGRVLSTKEVLQDGQQALQTGADHRQAASGRSLADQRSHFIQTLIHPASAPTRSSTDCRFFPQARDQGPESAVRRIEGPSTPDKPWHPPSLCEP